MNLDAGGKEMEDQDAMTINLKPGDPVPMPPEPRPQHEIIAQWKGDIEKPLVSICCITYNHEQYIEDALNGFLGQITDFPFEILINDDASTDNTPEIVRRYAEAYPKLIKAIYQTENKYSKGYMPNPSFNFPRAEGEFIAMCEGDDYWLSQHKLQQQYQIAKDNQVSVIFHSALELNMDNQDKKVVSRQQNYDGFIPLKDSVLGRGYFMPTASLFFHAKIIKERLYWFENDWPIGDFFLQMILSYEGKIYYIDEPMCLYRRNAQGSWTHKQKQKSEAIRFNHAMVSGIMKLYRLLGDRERKHLLAYPAFFYSKRLAYEKGEPILSIIWTASSVFLWDVSWSFKALYFMNAVYLPFSIVFRKIRNFQKLISRAL